MHVMIVGNSNTGKTNLAKSFANSTSSNIIVFDPVESKGWPHNAIKYADPEQFLDDCTRFRSAYVFIDECAVLWDFDEVRANELVYRGRHRGLLMYLLAQRTRMIRPNARNQCSRIYAFRQQYDDSSILAKEYTPDMMQCVSLQPGEFYATDGFRVEKKRLEYSSYPPAIVDCGLSSADDIPLDKDDEFIDETIET